jgi:hypothetical protein
VRGGHDVWNLRVLDSWEDDGCADERGKEGRKRRKTVLGETGTLLVLASLLECRDDDSSLGSTHELFQLHTFFVHRG